jgi:hypothetical protein
MAEEQASPVRKPQHKVGPNRVRGSKRETPALNTYCSVEDADGLAIPPAKELDAASRSVICGFLLRQLGLGKRGPPFQAAVEHLSAFTNPNNRQRRIRGSGRRWSQRNNFETDLALSPCVAPAANPRGTQPSRVPFNLVRADILVHGNMDGSGRPWLAYL